MNIFYISLMIVLIILFYLNFNRQLQNTRSIAPIMGWLVGIFYFLAIPLITVSINNGYNLPESWGVKNPWGYLDLNDPNFFFPIVVTWASLSLSLIFLYLQKRNKCLYGGIFSLRYSLKNIVNIFFICSLFCGFKFIYYGFFDCYEILNSSKMQMPPNLFKG